MGVPGARPYGVRVGGWGNNDFHRRVTWLESDVGYNGPGNGFPDNPVPRIAVMIP